MANQNRILNANPFDIPIGCNTRQRTKLTDIKRENAYNNIINIIGWSRFDWTLPEDITLTSAEIERATCCGVSVVYKVPPVGSVSDGMTVCTPLEWVGVRKADNTADDFITHLPYGDFSLTKSQLDENNVKYVIIRNNFEMTSDYDFTEWTAQMLNETDISELQLIKWSRMTPIAKTLSDEQTGQIENVLRRVYNGEPWAVVSDCQKLLTNSPTSRDDAILRLTDETAIEKMHFLSEFHYELIRRLCNLYNIPFHTTAKSSQNLESELHNTDIFSRFITEDGLNWRKKAAEDMRRVFGWENAGVELGKLYKMENEVIENIAEATADEPNDEQPEQTDESETGGEDGGANE